MISTDNYLDALNAIFCRKRLNCDETNNCYGSTQTEYGTFEWKIWDDDNAAYINLEMRTMGIKLRKMAGLVMDMSDLAYVLRSMEKELMERITGPRGGRVIKAGEDINGRY